jgi:hypothetical protein
MSEKLFWLIWAIVAAFCLYLALTDGGIFA